MDFLKEILGEDLYSQTKEKVDSYNQEHKDKPLKLVNLSEGAYISKEKFDAKETEANNLKEQLTNANNEIKSYKDMDIDSIKKSASDWEGKYNKLLEEQENAKNEEIRSQRTNDFFKDIKEDVLVSSFDVSYWNNGMMVYTCDKAEIIKPFKKFDVCVRILL